MGNVTQIYGLVNDAVSDFLGSTDVRAKDTASFVDLGRTLSEIHSADNPYAGLDSFYGALACRIAKTEVFVRLYERANRGVISDYQSFGAFVQRVYAALPSAVANPAWQISNGENPPTITSKSPYDVNTTVNITSLLFGKRGTWSVEVKMPYHQIKEAFLSEAAMQAFIDSIYIVISTKMNIDMEALENLAINTAMALCLHNGKATNLLAKYNAILPEDATPLTVEQALMSKDFLAFANKRIVNLRGYFKKPSRKYNVAGYETFTGTDKARLDVLSEYASASKFYLESTTFHKELVEMVGYNEVPFWQGTGDDIGEDEEYLFADSSKINISNASIYANEETGVAIPIEQSGIIAFLRDEDMVKAYFGDLYSWEVANVRERATNHGEEAETGYAVEPHANGWVFYVAEDSDDSGDGGDDSGDGGEGGGS